MLRVTQVGSKPRLGLGESSSGHEAQLGSELFVVVYYITVSQGPDYQVSLKVSRPYFPRWMDVGGGREGWEGGEPP